MDQESSHPTSSTKVSPKLISSPKPLKASFVNPKLKPNLSAASSQLGNNKKGKEVHVWIEKVSSKFASSSCTSTSRPPLPSLGLLQSLESTVVVAAAPSKSKSKRKKRNQRRKEAQLCFKTDLCSSSPSPVTQEPPLVISSASPSPSYPNGSPTSSSSPPSIPKRPPTLRTTSVAAQSWVEKALSNPSSSSLAPPLSSSSSSAGSPPSSPTLPPTLRQVAFSSALSHVGDQRGKPSSSWVKKGSFPLYKVPKNIKASIMKDLDHPLSALTYKKYFDALLYAEQVYLEDWRDYQMNDVKLKLHKAEITKPKNKDTKIFVVLKIDSDPERRPIFLSRDFVYARPCGKDVEPFKGILYGMVKSSHVLVEFRNNFRLQHHRERRYDISFSFNTLCFKRAHAAIRAAASYPLFHIYLFPDRIPRKSIISNGSPGKPPVHYELDLAQSVALEHMLGFYGPPPYIIEGQRCVIREGKSEPYLYKLSKTGVVVRAAALRIYESTLDYRMLICAPLNSTCDELMISLKKVIPKCDMYRINAAFREVEEVPLEIFLSCDHDGEGFSCPSLGELLEFRLIFATYSSSFRLYNEGMRAGDFSHIFLMDASLSTEPETMIALAHFANDSTAVIVTGAANQQPNLVRSGIARSRGLRTSYFARLSNVRRNRIR